MLELVILGLLKEGPQHGYELRQHIRDEFEGFANLSFGSLYPALSRLETSGSLRSLALDDLESLAPVGPFTGSLGGERAASIARRATAKAALALAKGTRRRKAYAITYKGEALFETLLCSPSGKEADSRSSLVRLAFARHLSPEDRIRLLGQMQAKTAKKLQVAREAMARSRRELDHFGRAIAQHTCDSLESELAWVERLLAEERDAALVGEYSRTPSNDRQQSLTIGQPTKEQNQ